MLELGLGSGKGKGSVGSVGSGSGSISRSSTASSLNSLNSTGSSNGSKSDVRSGSVTGSTGSSTSGYESSGSLGGGNGGKESGSESVLARFRKNKNKGANHPVTSELSTPAKPSSVTSKSEEISEHEQDCMTDKGLKENNDSVKDEKEKGTIPARTVAGKKQKKRNW